MFKSNFAKRRLSRIIYISCYKQLGIVPGTRTPPIITGKSIRINGLVLMNYENNYCYQIDSVNSMCYPESPKVTT